MAVLHHLIPNILNVSNFHNLALFICHLFIDGRFRTSHILYDPIVFDDQLIGEIHLNCPISVPFLMTDITDPPSSLWHSNENTDHILQLILFDPDHLPKDIDHFNHLLTFYRVLVLSSHGESNVEHRISTLEQIKTLQHNNLLILHHDSMTGSIWLHQTSDTHALDDRADICLKDEKTPVLLNEMIKCEETNLFDVTFGEKDRTWMTTVSYFFTHPMTKNRPSIPTWNGVPFIANLFISTLNATYINQTNYHLENGVIKTHYELNVPKQHRIYEELKIDYNSIDSKVL